MKVGTRILELQRKLVDQGAEDIRVDTLTRTVHALVPHLRDAIIPVIRVANRINAGHWNDVESLNKIAIEGGIRIQAIADTLAELGLTGTVPTIGQLDSLIRRYEERRWKRPARFD